MRLASGLLVVSAALGCAVEERPAPAPPPAIALEARGASPWSCAEQVALAVDGDERVCARPLEPRAGMHGQPRFEALTLASRGLLLTDRPVLDAAVRAQPLEVAFVTSERELFLWRDGGSVRLDGEVAAGLSFSPDGDRIAYAKGTPPELDIVIARVDGAGSESIAPHPAPDYLPAFAPDGTLAWVSSRDGHTAIWRLASGGPERFGPGSGAAPDGREPPAFGPGGIAFFDGRGVVLLGLDGARLGRIDDARRFVWLGAELVVERDGQALGARLGGGR